MIKSAIDMPSTFYEKIKNQNKACNTLKILKLILNKYKLYLKSKQCQTLIS